ncbi:MAG: hypothetical protein FD189_2487 [Elusimicrobia bacterium]|nr:MAG: hypothetical protein FD154_1542 [Elusimicrobiota bacterium]KAF0152339.1 MAG: hypothetical protein FD189_2487 [Elusimicrobiota bacterium]
MTYSTAIAGKYKIMDKGELNAKGPDEKIVIKFIDDRWFSIASYAGPTKKWTGAFKVQKDFSDFGFAEGIYNYEHDHGVHKYIIDFRNSGLLGPGYSRILVYGRCLSKEVPSFWYVLEREIV